MHIQGQIPSTHSLRTGGLDGNRHPPSTLFASNVASAGNPVVLVRGSLPVQLTAIGARGSVVWGIKQRGQPAQADPPAGGPRLSATTGTTVTLETDGVGEYIVTATCSKSHDQAQWHVCFATVELAPNGLQVTPDSTNSANGDNQNVMVSATLEFTSTVNVRAGGTGGLIYLDRVRVGVIQNMDDPGRTPLRGEYKLNSKRGTFAENAPVVAPPWIDASVKLPLYDTTVDSKSSATRVIKFSDTPGLTVPPFVKPAPLPATAVKEAGFGHYALIGAVGTIRFRSAIVAWSTFAPKTFTVIAELFWELRLNIEITDPSVTSPKCQQRGNQGAIETSRNEHPVPRDAAAAGYEVYGPEATSAAGEDDPYYHLYTWTQLPDVVEQRQARATEGIGGEARSRGLMGTRPPKNPSQTPEQKSVNNGGV